MSLIQYRKGDATLPEGAETKIVAHVCNDVGGWGRGFVVAISRRWPSAERAYRQWFAEASPRLELGAIQMVGVEPGIFVANMIAQRGLRATVAGPPIWYDALKRCLAALANEALQLSASVHMPRIGCGLAGGDWAKVEPIIEEALCSQSVEVVVYDFG